MKNKGIYLVANFSSENVCKNLVYSIRSSGCLLPIKIIHFGGEKIKSDYLLAEAELLEPQMFSKEGLEFVDLLQTELTGCPRGFLYRFLAWFGEWEEFIYSDNDIVALTNWNLLFDYLAGYDIVHADEEYLTEGCFNYNQPDRIKELFGEQALFSAITAGHFVGRRRSQMINDMRNAVAWFKTHPSIPKKHDQALLHVASLLGNWEILNLCKPPYNWLSSWAGDYDNSLSLIQKTQKMGTSISHLHYSGFKPTGGPAIEDLLNSNLSEDKRLYHMFIIALKKFSGFTWTRANYKKIDRRIKHILK